MIPDIVKEILQSHVDNMTVMHENQIKEFKEQQAFLDKQIERIQKRITERAEIILWLQTNENPTQP